MKSNLKCVGCDTKLTGRQRRFCSLHCKNADTNNRHQNYVSQQARGLQRKLRFLSESGTQCSQCGYRKNLAALAWHHIDPRQKSFALDMRCMSNRSELEIRHETMKCIVLCTNCHAEVHFPQLDLAKLKARSC